MIGFLKRSAKQASKETFGLFRLQPPPVEAMKAMYKFSAQEDVDRWLVGTDKDIGGFSTASLTLEETPDGPFASFKGFLSTQLPSLGNVAKSGYAAIKSRLLASTVFGHPYHDMARFRALGLRVRTMDNIQRQYFVNIKATTYSEQDLYQYPLEISLEKRGQWQDIQIPLRSFVLTNRGFVMEIQRDMPRTNVESIGISIAHQDGPFHLDLQEIKGVNPNGLGDEDIEHELLWAVHNNDKVKINKLSAMLGKQGDEQS